MTVGSLAGGATLTGPHAAIAAILDRDPAGVFPSMRLESRAEYVSAVVRLAAGLGLAPGELAERAVALCRGAPPAARPMARHVGYYLLGAGVKELTVGARRSPRPRPTVRDRAVRHARGLYVLAWATLVVGPAILAVAYARAHGAATSLLPLVAVGVAAVMLGSGMQFARQAITALVPPRPVPQLDFGGGIPDAWRALVAVHAVAGDAAALTGRLEQLAALAREAADPNLRCALLVDLPEADAEVQPGDAELLRAVAELTEAANASCRDARGDGVFVLVRSRQWSASERAWIGWERKRGKIEELNRLLRDPARTSSLAWRSGSFDDYVRRFPIALVVTLDGDSFMPWPDLLRLIEAAAHPLNRPVIDPGPRRVIDGFGMLKPHVRRVVPGGSATRLTRLLSTPRPPWRATFSPPLPRDFYFDVFGSAQYEGKGVYPVDAFRALFDDRFPIDCVLTHDRLEGVYARVAVVRRALCIEPEVTRLRAGWAQHHRWTRGNLQLLGWLLPRVRDRNHERARNPLPLSQRVRLLPGPIRQTNQLLSCIFIIAAWRALPGSMGFWLLFPLAYVLGDAAVYAVALAREACARPAGAPHAGVLARGAWLLRRIPELLGPILMRLVFMAHEAALTVDAIARVAWRQVTRRKLMEWVPQAEVNRAATGGLLRYLLDMAPAVALGCLLAAWALLERRAPLALAIFLGWALSFLAAWYLDRPVDGGSAG